MIFRKVELNDLGTRCVLAIVASLALAGTAFAQQGPHGLRDALLGRHGPPDTHRMSAAPPVARYVSDSGGGFIFDQASPCLLYTSPSPRD